MTKRQQAVEFFIRQGWTLDQSAGIIANLEAESGLRPDAVGDGGQAYGVAQWHPDRQAGFEALIGKPIRGSTLGEQLYWVHAELRHQEKSAGDRLAQCRTAAEAGACVSEYYERPADREGEARKRAALAEQIAQEYAGAAIPVPPTPTQPDAPPSAPAPDLPLPQPEKPMGAAAIFLPLIMQLVPQLFKVPGLQNVVNAVPTVGAAGGSPHAADYLPLVQAIVDTFTKAVPGAVNTQQAIEMAQANAKTAQVAAQAVLAAPDVVDELNKLAPVLDRLHKYDQDAWAAEDASRNEAANRALAQQREGPLYNNPTFLLAVLVMGLVCTVVIAVLFKGGFSTDMQAFVIGAIVGSALTAVLSFYFGSSRNSAAKDATISRLATGPRQ